MPTYYPNDIKYNPVPFDLTYVLYDPKDSISMLCVHLSLLPIYTMVFYAAWFLLTREIEPVVVVGGHLVSEIVNKILKRLIKEPRPEFHKDFGAGSFASAYGMPSAHSQFVGFFVGYFICVIIFKLGHLTSIQKQIGIAVLSLASIGVCFSRVYLLYHTTQQVIVGAMFGALLGSCYFVITSILRDVGVVDWVLEFQFIKFFYIKDSYFHSYKTFKDEYEFYLSLVKADALSGKL